MSSGETDTISGTRPEPQIIEDEDRLGGAAHVAGTRIRVSDIVVDYNYHDLSPEEIADEYPSIMVSDVYAALAYFSEHTQEVRAEIREREQQLDAGE